MGGDTYTHVKQNKNGCLHYGGHLQILNMYFFMNIHPSASMHMHECRGHPLKTHIPIIAPRPGGPISLKYNKS